MGNAIYLYNRYRNLQKCNQRKLSYLKVHDFFNIYHLHCLSLYQISKVQASSFERERAYRHTHSQNCLL